MPLKWIVAEKQITFGDAPGTSNMSLTLVRDDDCPEKTIIGFSCTLKNDDPALKEFDALSIGTQVTIERTLA